MQHLPSGSYFLLLSFVLTYITYLLTYLFTYTLTYIGTYVLTYLLTYLLTHLLTQVRTYVRTYLLTYLLTYSVALWSSESLGFNNYVAVTSLSTLFCHHLLTFICHGFLSSPSIISVQVFPISFSPPAYSHIFS